MKRLIAGALAALFVMQTSVAFAASMTWRLRAFDKHAVDVTFYSKSRKAVWPGNGQVWTIRDYNVKTFKLNCIVGEKICYGAWVRGSSREYWGVGQGGTRGCKTCCYTCSENGVTPILNLNE